MFSYNTIVQLPDRLLLQKRLTKAFFLKNFVLTAAEKKTLNQTIITMEWLASIKPALANIPAVKGETWVYEEIQIITCTVHDINSKLQDCIELFQKHIPYQMVLFVEDENCFVVNTCNKRVNQNDNTKRTIEGYFTTPSLSKLYKTAVANAFFEALNYNQLDKTNLETLYKSYNRAVVQYQTAALTGTYTLRTQQRTEEDMQHLQHIEGIENEITSLSSQLKKAVQLNDRVNLNVQIQKKRNDIEKLKQLLIVND